MKEKKKEKTSSERTSSEEEVPEDFDWIKDKKFLIEDKKDFLNYPLSKWKDEIYDREFEENAFIHSHGFTYEEGVLQILEDDVFKDLYMKFYINERGGTLIKLMEHYEVDPDKLVKNFIVPDFFIYKIEVEKFKELLKDRRYMMKTFKKLETDKKYVSIIGEVKCSHKRAFKSNIQSKDYISFIQNANLKDEELLLMYVYDQSYKLFKEDKIDSSDSIFRILCYMPRLYRRDCYYAYNNIIDHLNLDKRKKINLEIFQKKPFTRRELRKEVVVLKGEIGKYKIEIENRNRKEITRTIIIVSVFILIIAFILKLKIN